MLLIELSGGGRLDGTRATIPDNELVYDIYTATFIRTLDEQIMGKITFHRTPRVNRGAVVYEAR